MKSILNPQGFQYLGENLGHDDDLFDLAIKNIEKMIKYARLRELYLTQDFGSFHFTNKKHQNLVKDNKMNEFFTSTLKYTCNFFHNFLFVLFKLSHVSTVTIIKISSFV